MSSGIIAMMLGVSIFLGSIALIAFLWGLKSGQFDDSEKFLNAAKFDNEDDLQSAVEAQKKKEELKARKKAQKDKYQPE
ncbi:Type cbb3 cytochrome oxidase biogenesis protein CcoS, involved in heme b insertion [hydrothermal vent metagenome]|uniref:Type cbb3 cytochrome oxidase biogenesis protein CcoS, involved in heme b insertion n=1 Tax=hydrothermal vent metagenome TaxID=652676 RepID=A0A1W1BBR5_9ZZZZ